MSSPLKLVQIFVLSAVCIPSIRLLQAQESRIELVEKVDRVSVLIDGDVFTEYIYQGYEKPILYPIIGPTGAEMTRNYPMKKGVENEADDHPHHKSIWFGHMRVNGSSFWHSGDTAGTTQQTKIVVRTNTIHSENKLVAPDGSLVAQDSRQISFGVGSGFRTIDYSVTYHASEADIEFGDDKDGQMGIRMHPSLRIKGPIAQGRAINSRGVRENDIWGKRAEWIDYWGPVDGKTVGIAVFDHPDNLRHPTWWHARDYGLLSANPFGIHHFEELPNKAQGQYILAKGETLTFKHRFVFHVGDPKQADVKKMYSAWIESTD